MEIRRTANAGVLLKLDGVAILLDGVCREVKPYPATPPEERQLLTGSWPDVVAFTHGHKDHFDPVYAAEYQKQTNGVLLGPEGLAGIQASLSPVCVGGVTVTPIPSRHIGIAGKTTPHVSFVIEGSSCVWFLGDASPSQWQGKALPKPDVLIVPYAYATTESAWKGTKALQARMVILLHLPERELDVAGLWNAVESTVKEPEIVKIPAMSEIITV